jgi:hypothetical protein
MAGTAGQCQQRTFRTSAALILSRPAAGKGRVDFTAALAGRVYAHHGTTIEIRFWPSLSVSSRT